MCWIYIYTMPHIYIYIHIYTVIHFHWFVLLPVPVPLQAWGRPQGLEVGSARSAMGRRRCGAWCCRRRAWGAGCLCPQRVPANLNKIMKKHWNKGNTQQTNTRLINWMPNSPSSTKHKGFQGRYAPFGMPVSPKAFVCMYLPKIDFRSDLNWHFDLAS